MNHSVRRQHHEQARKRHRQQLQQHERAVAKQGPSTVALWILVVCLICIGIFVLAAITW